MSRPLKRRQYVKLMGASVASVSIAGCGGGGGDDGSGDDGSGGDGSGGDGGGDGSGGDGSGDDGSGGGDRQSVDLPSITNRSGPGSENGVPIAEAESDLIQYINDEELLDVDFEYHDQDAAYDPSEILNVYQSFVDEYDPGLILGDGSPSGHTLAERIAADEILQVIPFGTLSPSVGIENSYHVTASNDYITQNRVALELIAQEDPGARVNLIVPPENPAGVESRPALEYADDLDLEKGEVMEHPLGAASADSIIQRAREDEVDWVVHTTGAPAHTVVLSSIDEVYPELNAVGVGPACTERRAMQSPDLYEGTFWVSSFKTFDEVASGDTGGADVLETVFENYRDTSLEDADPEVAVVDYIRGMAAVDLVKRIFELTIENGGDLTSGPDLRESLHSIEDYEGWGTMAPRTYTEDDPRGNMVARAYQAQEGEWDFMNEFELERTDEWLPSEVL